MAASEHSVRTGVLTAYAGIIAFNFVASLFFISMAETHVGWGVLMVFFPNPVNPITWIIGLIGFAIGFDIRRHGIR